MDREEAHDIIVHGIPIIAGKDDYTPLHIATMNGDCEIFELL